jgi:cytochrome c oxidase assembly protein subunit 11
VTAATLQQRNIRRTAMIAIGFALAMLGLGYAASPLYRLFCAATGYAGTTRRASEAEAASASAMRGVANSEVLMRFDANVERGMPWTFRPEHASDTITLGGRHMAFFLAENTSDKPVTGRATFNVTPEQSGRFFNKIQCFCFTEQTLQPHQQVHMPVIYFVDPKIKDDPDARGIDEITLSYTFHKIAER